MPGFLKRDIQHGPPRLVLRRFGQVVGLDVYLDGEIGDAAVRPLREGAG